MFVIVLNAIFYCILDVLMLSLIANLGEATPLDLTMTRSLSRESNEIYFLGNQTVKPNELNEINDDVMDHVANVSRCAINNQTYCTKDDNYPIDIIRKLLQENPHLNYGYERNYFSEDITRTIKKTAENIGEFANHYVDTERKQSRILSGGFSFRHNAANEIQLCESFKKLQFVTTAQNKVGYDVFVVNTDKFKQAIDLEECTDTGVIKPCTFYESLPNGYSTACEQEFVYFKTWILAPDTKNIIKDEIRLPGYCKCKVFED